MDEKVKELSDALPEVSRVDILAALEEHGSVQEAFGALFERLPRGSHPAQPKKKRLKRPASDDDSSPMKVPKTQIPPATKSTAANPLR